MHLCRPLPIVLCMLLSSGMTGQAASEQLIDFNNPVPFITSTQEFGGSFITAADPEGRPAGGFRWAAKHFSWCSFTLPATTSAMISTGAPHGVLGMRIYSPGTEVISEINLRLVDAKGEIFQWRQAVDLARKGWHDLTYDLSTPWGESWGEHKSGIAEGAVRIDGLAFVFHAADTPPGEVRFSDIVFHPTIGDVDTERSVRTFDDGENWRMIDPPPGVTWADREGHGEIGLPAGAAGVQARLGELPPEAIPLLGRPYRVTLRLALAGNAAVEARFGMRDADGKDIAMTPLALKPGENRLQWDIDPAAYRAPFHEDELTLQRGGGGTACQVRLLELVLDERMAPLAALDVDVDTGNRLHLIHAGKSEQLLLSVKNHARQAQDIAINGKMVAWNGIATPFAVKMGLPAMGEATAPLAIPRQLGQWNLDYVITSADGASQRAGATAFCRIMPREVRPLTTRSNGFLTGINLHSSRFGVRQRLLDADACAFAGVDIIRQEFDWCQDADGTYRMDWIPAYLDIWESRGIEVHALLNTTPQWAAAPETRSSKNWLDWGLAPPDLAAWGRNSAEIARRFGDRIRFWEIRNEPDLTCSWHGTVEEYLQVLKTAYQGIKAVRADARVMTAGFACAVPTTSTAPTPNPYLKYRNFAEQILRDGQDWFDIHCQHPYTAEWEDVTKMRSNALRSQKPLFITETGMNGSQVQQALGVARGIPFYMSHAEVTGVEWYELRDDGFNDHDTEQNFGLLTCDGHPKPAYAVYANLTRQMEGAKFLGALDPGPSCWGGVFAAAGGTAQVVVAWNADINRPERQLVLTTDAGSATLIDMMGNASPIAVVQGRVILPLQARTAYLRLEGAHALPAIAGSVLGIDNALIAVPGRPLGVDIALFNPFDAPEDFTITSSLPEAMGIAAAKSIVRVPAGAHVTSSLSFALPPALPGNQGTSATVKISYHMGAHGLDGSLSAPLFVAISLPAGNFDRAPDFLLTRKDQVVDLFGYDALSAKLMWRGPDDLSAKVWLTRDDANLKLRVEVTDDILSQSEQGGKIYIGDSIQLALQVPGQTGHWEMGLAPAADGGSQVFTWIKPDGMADPTARIQLHTSRQGKLTLYEADLPMAAFGITDAVARAGLRFNLLINDNDGDGRKGWVELAPGIGKGKHPELYPFVVFAPK